jgi:hypothetical protein
MPCKFCGVSDETTTNHGSSAACVNALNTEIARLRSRQKADLRSFVLEGPPQQHERQPVKAMAPRLALRPLSLRTHEG